MILVQNLSVRAGAFTIANVNFSVATGGYAVLMGRTGSGKTTLLEGLCGLKPIAAGRIELMGHDVTHLPPSQRGIGYVPQDRALFSTMTVWHHLAFALKIREWPRREIQRRVAELADLLGIAHLLHRKPAGLSGGESQRVALGRALASHPRILLLDEPLSALDDDTRLEMYDLLGLVRRHTGVTTLHITHNGQEAARLADSLLLIRDGIVAPAAIPRPVL